MTGLLDHNTYMHVMCHTTVHVICNTNVYVICNVKFSKVCFIVNYDSKLNKKLTIQNLHQVLADQFR